MGLTTVATAGHSIHDGLCFRRAYMCPVCALEFVVLYKDGDPLRHSVVAIDCPRGPDGRDVLGRAGPLCEGRILTDLPARYLVVPAPRRVVVRSKRGRS